MGTSYTRVLKPGAANKLSAIIKVSQNVQRVLSGIVSENGSTEHEDEVQIQMQPSPDGALAIIGWIGREAVEGIPDEQYDDEIEMVPRTDLPPPELNGSPTAMPPQQSPFQR